MAETTGTLPKIVSLPVSSIVASRHQLRKDFEEEGIKNLSVSIDKEGLLQPITVRFVDGVYELIAGERRLRAVQLLGRDNIYAIIVEVPSEAAAAAKGLVENIQRKDLNPMEEARGYAELQRLDSNYWTQSQIAEIAGKTQGRISQSLSLLGLAEPIQDEIARQTFSYTQGIELARLSDKSKQLEIFEKAKDLTLAKLKVLVDGALGGEKKASKKKEKPRDPLSDVWPKLLADTTISTCNYWKVEFKKDEWAFKASTTKFATAQDFADWFHQMGDAMANLATPPGNGHPQA
jgi:ParB family chromosome partitioning protein